MNMKSINNFIKVVIISGIVVMFNICNIVPSFASDSNLYIINNQYVDNNNVITKYSNGSLSFCNYLTGKYSLTEKDSTIEFNSTKDLLDNISKKNNIEKIPSILKNNQIIEGISSHSDKIYCDDLSTDKKLQQYANQWLKDNYNMNLNVPIIYDNLDDKTNGYYSYKDGKFKLIQINQDLKGIDIGVEKTLIHELVHMVLFETNKDFKDETNSFRKECIEKGSNTNYGEIGYLHSHLKCTM